MNYFVIPIQNIDQADLGKLAYESPSGYITFLSTENENFYYLYRGGNQRSLTPYWRRGAPLHLFHKLKFLKKARTGEAIKIRRDDFKQIFTHLNQIQKQSNAWCHLQILADQLTISHINQEDLSFQLITLKLHKRLEQLCHDFIQILQKNILQNKHPQESIRSYQKKILKEEPLLEKLSGISSQTYKIIFTGSSYQLLSSIAKIFFKHPVIALGLAGSNGTISKSSRKIRKVIVLNNLSGGYLFHLDSNREWWDRGPSKILWKHIQGRLRVGRVKQLIEEEKIFQNYDTVIYRGHASIKNQNICWILDDGEFLIDEYYMNRYIHLSCLNISHRKDDLKRIPFKEGILPLGFFPDRDEALLIKNIFKLIESGRNFRDACLEALWQNKEYQFFSYWFS